MNVVKYRDFDGKEIDAPTRLIVRRKNKYNKCRCHHCRIGSDGRCCFGRCHHEQTVHFKVMRLM